MIGRVAGCFDGFAELQSSPVEVKVSSDAHFSLYMYRDDGAKLST